MRARLRSFHPLPSFVLPRQPPSSPLTLPSLLSSSLLQTGRYGPSSSLPFSSFFALLFSLPTAGGISLPPILTSLNTLFDSQTFDPYVIPLLEGGESAATPATRCGI